MATFLFWNLHRNRDVVECIHDLVVEHDVDLLVLAECVIPELDLLQGINEVGRPEFWLAFHPSPMFRILTHYPPGAIVPVRDTERISIRRLVPPLGVDMLFVAAHLPSKTHMSADGQAMLCTRLASYVHAAEEAVGHARTVIFGDLNMNPFELGVVGSEGLHATMSERVAARGARVVQGEARAFFYNPMWRFLGDRPEGPPGTHYYDNSGEPVNYFWNVFDQVLIRPALLPMFADESLEVLTRAGQCPLITAGQVLQHSDHLPVKFRIDLEKEQGP